MNTKEIAENSRYIAAPATNRYLGESTFITYFLSESEKKISGLTDDSIILLVKTKNPVLPVESDNGGHLFTNSSFSQELKVPLRIMSSCITGMLGDLMCDCHGDMVKHLETINETGEGVFVYLPQEGMGRGLKAKIIDHRLQKGIGVGGNSIDPVDFETATAQIAPGEKFDIRTYTILEECFKTLGLFNLSYEWLGNKERGKLFTEETNISIFQNNKKI